jgi:hypothetical protein
MTVLSNDIIIEVFKYADYLTKRNMIKTFPFLKDLLPKCEFCKKQSCLVVKFESYDNCNDCPNHLDISEYTFICNLKCKGLYYDVEYGEQNISNGIINASLLCEKDDCYSCGSRIMYEVKTTGFQLYKQPKLPLAPIIKSQISIEISSFLKENLIENKDGKIPPSVLITIFIKKYKNYLYKEIATEIHKHLRRKKNFFIGYELKYNYIDSFI